MALPTAPLPLSKVETIQWPPATLSPLPSNPNKAGTGGLLPLAWAKCILPWSLPPHPPHKENGRETISPPPPARQVHQGHAPTAAPLHPPAQQKRPRDGRPPSPLPVECVKGMIPRPLLLVSPTRIKRACTEGMLPRPLPPASPLRKKNVR